MAPGNRLSFLHKLNNRTHLPTTIASTFISRGNSRIRRERVKARSPLLGALRAALARSLVPGLVPVDKRVAAAGIQSPDLPCDELPQSNPSESLRHSFVVRVTHWIYTASFIGLVVSGCGILLAHPRFYWGEAGGPGGPSLFELPLPTMRGGPSGWGRHLHFQSAWLAVSTGFSMWCTESSLSTSAEI